MLRSCYHIHRSREVQYSGMNIQNEDCISWSSLSVHIHYPYTTKQVNIYYLFYCHMRLKSGSIIQSNLSSNGTMGSPIMVCRGISYHRITHLI